ncbi:amidohydrolase [Lachnospiraceae bacterium NSJ-143]|nr:amidohydrolase [Lachnospiraceae bacterium NSJ-143]
MEKIFYNGKILTMAENIYTQAVLVSGGKITETGMFEKLSTAHPEAEKVNLGGKTMMPAFIDSHSHFASCAVSFLQPSLEECKSIDDILNKIKEHITKNNPSHGKWISLRGYDQNSLAEKSHPDKKLIDSVSPHNPVVIQHKSGHSGIFNSFALKELGLTEATENGYMAENEFINAVMNIPLPDEQEILESFKRTQELYLSYGITTAQEGMFVKELIPLYQLLLKSKILKIDIVGYASLKDLSDIEKAFECHIKNYKGHFKLGGIKVFLDGSPQIKTAYMNKPYTGTSERGMCTMSNEELSRAVETAVSKETQIICHANGDAACDMFINAIKESASHSTVITKLNPVIIHAQFINPCRLLTAGSLGMTASFFVSHILHYGETHIQNLGLNRASQMSPLNSAQHSLNFTLHRDSPVMSPDMFESVYCAVSRRTSTGRVLGENQKISIINALRAVTVNAAKQYSEENLKGSIAEGKAADFIILDKNPLDVSVDDLLNIKILETIKDGSVVWQNNKSK